MTKTISPVDILAIAAHPDDVELACSGTIIKSIEQGNTVGICDMTQGELGTRGSAELRLVEAEKARTILGASFRVNLKMKDGFFEESEDSLLSIIQIIRAAKPHIVLLNAKSDRHPDHGRASQLQKRACFLSGLRKIETSFEGKLQDPHRPEIVLCCIQDRYLEPNIVVDVSDQWKRKMQAIQAFESQFYNPNSDEPSSAISSKEFIEFVEGRGIAFGRLINTKYGEGFTSDRPIGLTDLSSIS